MLGFLFSFKRRPHVNLLLRVMPKYFISVRIGMGMLHYYSLLRLRALFGDFFNLKVTLPTFYIVAIRRVRYTSAYGSPCDFSKLFFFGENARVALPVRKVAGPHMLQAVDRRRKNRQKPSSHSTYGNIEENWIRYYMYRYAKTGNNKS